MVSVLPSAVETFRARVDRSAGPEACWPYTGPHSGLHKHPVVYLGMHDDGTVIQRPSHRVAYLLEHGWDSLTSGERLRLTCENAVCCNPAHIERPYATPVPHVRPKRGTLMECPRCHRDKDAIDFRRGVCGACDQRTRRARRVRRRALGA